MTLYHLERVGNESEIKSFDVGFVTFYKLSGGYKKGFMDPLAWVYEAFTNMTRSVKLYTSIIFFFV